MGEGNVQFNSVHGVQFSGDHGPGQVKDMI